MRRFAFAFSFLALSAFAAEAMVLSCFPLRAEGPVKIDAYVDGVAEGDYPPRGIEAVRVLARFGEDVYEFEPEHTREAMLRDGVLRIHLLQPLSAGQTAEMRFEGKIGAQKGALFTMRMFIRGEQRVGQGSVRCTIE